jgi:predicted RNase H-like HicB family nuclease
MTTPSTSKTEIAVEAGEEFEVLLVTDDREPGYAVFCPSLPGCNSQGDDRDDALAMIADAIQGFLMFASRPSAPEGRKERLIEEYTADGCQVEVVTVRVVV